jgi:hypothetical protein
MKTREELGYCGVDCEECNIYRTTVYGEELKTETVKRWQEDLKKFWGIDSLDPKQFSCRGCRFGEEDVFLACRLCPIRGCCKKQGLSSCGICLKFQTCELSEPDGKKNLEAIAATEK